MRRDGVIRVTRGCDGERAHLIRATRLGAWCVCRCYADPGLVSPSIPRETPRYAAPAAMEHECTASWVKYWGPLEVRTSATIRLFLPRGDAKSLRTAEISNWTGKAIAAPRTELDDLLAREELDKAGVYILIGSDPKTNAPRAYIGEAEVIRGRDVIFLGLPALRGPIRREQDLEGLLPVLVRFAHRSTPK